MSGFRRFANDPPVDELYSPRPANDEPTSTRSAFPDFPFFSSADLARRRADRQIERDRRKARLEEDRGGLTSTTRFVKNFVVSLDFLSPLVATIALTGAIIITTIAVYAYYRPNFLGSDLTHHLAVGSMFFWIELGAIILGFRAIDTLYDGALYQERLYALLRMLENVFDVHKATSEKFQKEIIESLQKADPNNPASNAMQTYDMLTAVDNWRDCFSVFALRDAKCNPVIAIFVERILLSLDDMTNRTQSATDRFVEEARSPEAKSNVVDNRLFEIVDAADPYFSDLYNLLYQIRTVRKNDWLHDFLKRNDNIMRLRHEGAKPPAPPQ